MPKTIYLDHANGTPLDREVAQAMIPYIEQNYGNPSSNHQVGNESKKAIDKARAEVAELIGASEKGIIFTSCGSESNNLAIKGLAFARENKRRHIIISSVEHFSVMDTAKTLERMGWEVTRLPVDNKGIVDPDDVRKAIRKDTVCVSIIHASGEIGTIEPVKEIGKITREAGVPFHTDAVQTAGTIPAQVEELGVDLLSLSAQQFYGPKGAAALYIRPGITIRPIIDGGAQENGRRAGTENVPAIVGMGVASRLAKESIDEKVPRITALRDHFITALQEKIPRVILNGHPKQRLPGNVHISVEFVEGESLVMSLSMAGIMAASGSSCTAKDLKASHVLLACGVDHARANASLLFSLGKDNTMSEVDEVVETLIPIVKRLRNMSPLWNGS